MRDRLIELINRSDILCRTCGENTYTYCAEAIVDYLLENGVIVPPCKIGDMVYRVVTMGTGVTFKKVGYNTYREKEQTIKHFIRCVTVTKNNFFDVIENFGKTVFLTKEEAEQALKGGAGL